MTQNSVWMCRRLSSSLTEDSFFFFFLLSFGCAGSSSRHGALLVAVHGFSCPLACKTLIPWPRIEPVSPELEGGFLTTGLSGKSPKILSWLMRTGTCTDLWTHSFFYPACELLLLNSISTKSRTCPFIYFYIHSSLPQWTSSLVHVPLPSK